MKRPNRYGGSHAQAPQPTRITAIIIISFFIAAVLVGLILLICATHKLGGDTGNYNKSLRKAPVDPAHLIKLDVATLQGGVTGHPSRGKPVNRLSAHSITTLPLEEPLEGGGTATNGMETATNSPAAPQQRDRPAIEVMQSEVVEAQKARERADLVARIDAFLGNSPLRGLGEVMMQNAERTGVWVMLCPAQAYAESSLGNACCYPFQAWGMYGVNPSSWEDAIVRYFDNIVKHWGQVQNAHELVNPDYCEPSEPYNTNVQGLAESI